eukprot:s9_g24.t1
MLTHKFKQFLPICSATEVPARGAARGAFVLTLLQVRALEVVEHLKAEEYQRDGGDLVLFGLLDKRWPQKDRADELGEHVSEVFLLTAKEGESIRAWSSRAQEVFVRCKRKTEAMHSCYPEYIVPKRRVNAAHYMEEEGEAWYTDRYGQADYGEPEHNQDEPEDEVEIFPEKEVAEVLAATWKDKRAELSRLFIPRGSGRAEEEDAMSKTTAASGAGAALSSSSGPSGAGLVQNEKPGPGKQGLSVDFGKDEMVLFQEGVRIPLQVNEAGQYVVPVLDKEPVEPPESSAFVLEKKKPLFGEGLVIEIPEE